MAEYHPEWDYNDYSATQKTIRKADKPETPKTVNSIPPMPKVKPPKDAGVEDSALRSIMSLAIFGAGIKAGQDGTDQHTAISECLKLFKDAGFVQ